MSRLTLDHPLRALHGNLVRLSCLVDQAIQQASQALATRNLSLARQVVAGDSEVNALRYRIEDHCLAIIATQQPAAHDLRMIMAVFSMATELERMADLASGLATLALWIGDEPCPAPAAGLVTLAEQCRQMLRRALDAYLSRNVALARQVIASDDLADDLYQEVFQGLRVAISQDARQVSRILPLLFAAHNLERIGDRAVNLAERSLFAMNVAWKNTPFI